jgi:hypothetical protein
MSTSGRGILPSRYSWAKEARLKLYTFEEVLNVPSKKVELKV